MKNIFSQPHHIGAVKKQVLHQILILCVVMLLVFTAFSSAPVNAAGTASLTVQQTVTTLGTATDPYSAYRFHLELFGPAVTISGQIIWDDFSNAYGARPVDVNIYLQRNGITVDNVVIDAAQNWQFAFRNRAKYDENGTAYIYTVSQHTVDNYTTIQSGFNFTNSISTVSVTAIYVDKTTSREIARETRYVAYNSSLVLVPPSLGGYTLDRPTQFVLIQIKTPVEKIFYYTPISAMRSAPQQQPDENDANVSSPDDDPTTVPPDDDPTTVPPDDDPMTAPPEDDPATVPSEDDPTTMPPADTVASRTGGVLPKQAAVGFPMFVQPALQACGIADSGVAPMPIPAAELARLQLAGYNIVSDGADGYLFTLQGGHSITIQSLVPETQFVVTQLGAIQAGTAVSLDPEACTVDLLNAAGAFAGYPVAAGTVIAGAESTVTFSFSISAVTLDSTPTTSPDPAPPHPAPPRPATRIPQTGDRSDFWVWIGAGSITLLISIAFLRKKSRI